MGSDIKSFTYRLANDQINNIKHNYDQPGWTLWALLIALANCLWLLIHELETGLPNFNAIETLAFLFGTIFIYLSLYSFIKIINYRKIDNSEDRFHYPRILAGSTRVNLLYSLIVNAIIFYLCKHFFHVDHFTVLSIKTYIIIISFLQIIAFLSSLLPFPTKKNLSYHFLTKLVLLIIFSIFPLVISIQSIVVIDLHSFTFFQSLKISALGFLIYFLIDKLSLYVVKNPILIELEKISHDLSFNMISPDAALERIEIAVDGLKLKHVFKEDVSFFLDLFHIFSQKMDEAKKTLVLLKSRFKELSVDNVKQVDIPLDPTIKSLLNNLNSIITYLQLIQDDIGKRIIRFQRKLIIIRKIVKNDTDLYDIVNNLSLILEKEKVDTHDFKNEVNEFLKKFTNLLDTAKSGIS